MKLVPKYKTYIVAILMLTLVFELFVDFGVRAYQTEMIFGANQKIIEKQCDLLGHNRGIINWALICLPKIPVSDRISPTSDSHSQPIKIHFSQRLIPFIFSLAIIPLTYITTQSITNSKPASIISTLLTTIHPVYLIFNSSQYFSYIWVVFFLVSVYVLNKKPSLTALPFLATLFAKALPILWIPAILLIMKTQDKKIPLLIFVLVLCSLIAYHVFDGNFITSSLAHPHLELDMPEFKVKFKEIVIPSKTLVKSPQIFIPTLTIESSYTLAFAWNMTAILTPFLLVWLYRNETPRQIFYFLCVMLASIVLLPILTVEETFAYRSLPFVIFLNMAVALVMTRWLQERKIVKTLLLFLLPVAQYVLLIVQEWNGTNFDILIF